MGLELNGRINLREKTVLDADDIVTVVHDPFGNPELKKVRISNLITGISGISSNPPGDNYKVTNIYVNSETRKLIVEYEVQEE